MVALALDGGVVVHGLAEGDRLVAFRGLVLAAVGQARVEVLSEGLRVRHLAAVSKGQPGRCDVFGLVEGTDLRVCVGGGSGMFGGWP